MFTLYWERKVDKQGSCEVRAILGNTKRMLYTFWEQERLIPSELRKEGSEMVEFEFGLSKRLELLKNDTIQERWALYTLQGSTAMLAIE